MPAPLLLIELNEFNPEMIETAARELELPHLARIFELNHSETSTDDEIEHQGLDPWVQWVSVHCGAPSTVHKVSRLGHTRGQNRPQIWELVGNSGRRWGAWGVMNAPLGQTGDCAFFMPDPWSFDERAHPAELNNLLALPRYAARNYLKFEPGKFVVSSLRTAWFFLSPRRWGMAARLAAWLVRGTATAGLNIHTLATLTDYVSVLNFLDFRRRERPELSVIFLNHIAHLQHQFWRKDGKIDPNMKFGLIMANHMLGLLHADLAENEAWIIANGMRQRNVSGENWCIFRQIHPGHTLEALGITYRSVEQCMTHDANILFENARDRDAAMGRLASCRLAGSGEPVFFVEAYGEASLFYQILIEHGVDDGAQIEVGNLHIPFFDLFALICERTGAHEQRGDVYSQGVKLASQFKNHELFDGISSHFELNKAPEPVL